MPFVQPLPHLPRLANVVYVLYPAIQDVDGSWAGGRGFKKQPYLTVMDAGGGMVSSDSVTKVSVTVTPSLMVRWYKLVLPDHYPIINNCPSDVKVSQHRFCRPQVVLALW